MKLLTLKLVLEHLAEHGEGDADAELEVTYVNKKPEAVLRFSSHDEAAADGESVLHTIWPDQTDQQILWNLGIKEPIY